MVTTDFHTKPMPPRQPTKAKIYHAENENGRIAFIYEASPLDLSARGIQTAGFAVYFEAYSSLPLIHLHLINFNMSTNTNITSSGSSYRPKTAQGMLFALACAANFSSFFMSAATAAEPARYFKVSLAGEVSRDTRISDRDCNLTNPPALFGCGTGNDGQPLGATGDFGSGVAIDTALGYRFSDTFRAEVLLSYRPSLDLSAKANFLGVSGEQPVQAELASLGIFAVGYLDLPRLGYWQPYLGAGLGRVRNRIGVTHYHFPSLGPNAETVLRGGNHYESAYLLTVGAEVPLSPAWKLDVAYRYSDLGEVRNDDGAASIIRTSRTRVLDIAGTQARLKTQGIIIGLRYAF